MEGKWGCQKGGESQELKTNQTYLWDGYGATAGEYIMIFKGEKVVMKESLRECVWERGEFWEGGGGCWGYEEDKFMGESSGLGLCY